MPHPRGNFIHHMATSMRNGSSFVRPLGALFCVSLLALGGCGVEQSDSPASNLFVVRNSGYAMAPSNAKFVTNGSWLFFLADEAASGGQNLNNDLGGATDQVGIVVNMPGNTEKNLGIAAVDAVWVGFNLYMVVDEALDERDHGGSAGATDLVLMHWRQNLDAPAFVATLDRQSRVPLVSVGTTLIYASDETPTGATESSLYAIDSAFPQTPRPIFTQDSVNPLRPRIVGKQNGLVFLVLDETFETLELNGDGDMDDRFVLALLDGTGQVDSSGYSLMVRNTELAISGVNSPMRAKSTGANDWLFGFLVSEADQEQNFNTFGGAGLPASWEPNPSNPCGDTDELDEVLHGIRFSLWNTDPVTNPPVNTGISGGERVLIAGDALATICLESEENDCVLNADGDSTDRILRWIRLDLSTSPYSNAGPNTGSVGMLALDDNLSGPALSVAELQGAFVIQCDEAADGRNYDGAAGAATDRNLVAWLDPQDAVPVWKFDHGTFSPFYATATWMGEQPLQTRLGIAFAESSNQIDRTGDGDLLDSLPTWVELGGSERRLSFFGRFLAADKDNAGITLANGFGFFRFSEAEHGADFNGNNNSTDTLLVRVNLASALATNMGTLNTLERLAIDTDRDGNGGGGVFLFQESLAGSNLNGDNDSVDYVPRFFRLP